MTTERTRPGHACDDWRELAGVVPSTRRLSSDHLPRMVALEVSGERGGVKGRRMVSEDVVGGWRPHWQLERGVRRLPSRS